MSKINKKDFKTLALSSLGGTLEFYDFIIFVFFASIISKHFFPDTLSDTWKSVNTYGIFAAGYLARPLGGIVMAHFGDKFGRKNMFMLSILLMVIPTFLLAIVPTFESIGYAAPIFLILVRISQGIAVGGELPGAWVFISEHAPKERRNLYLSFLTASVTAGILLGALVYLGIYAFFTASEVQEWAWRIGFGLGGVFGLISVYLRKFLQETPIFKKMKEDKALAKFPLKEVLKSSKLGVIISMLMTLVLTACILIFILIMPNLLIKPNTLGVVKLDFSVFEKTYLQICGLFFLVSSIVFCGYLADKFKVYKLCILYTLGFLLCSICFFSEIYSLEKSQNLIILFYLSTCFFAGIMGFCPIFMCDVFQSNVKFSGISFAYNIAYALAGGFTPQLVSFLDQRASEGFYTYALSFYMLLVCLASFLACYLFSSIQRTKTQ